MLGIIAAAEAVTFYVVSLPLPLPLPPFLGFLSSLAVLNVQKSLTKRRARRKAEKDAKSWTAVPTNAKKAFKFIQGNRISNCNALFCI